MDENTGNEMAAAAGAEVEGGSIEETVTQIRSEMQHQQQAHQQQMQQMMTMFGQAIQAQGTSTAQPVSEPAPPVFDLGVDEDDPYSEQFGQLVKQMSQSQNELAQMKQQFGEFALNSQRADLSSQVDSALEQHNVPDVLKDNVRQVVYAYMAQANEPVSPAPLVENWMKSLSQHVDTERKDWAKDAGRSRRFSALGGAPGVLKDKPKTWDEAKAASFAMLVGQKPQ
jgi:hypothetical protein